MEPYTTYSDDEKAIVRSGMPAIRSVLNGSDTEAKKRLLFCLDWFMDPYYGQDISAIRDELELELQSVVVFDADLNVKEDAIQLLTDYTWGPYPVLSAHLHEIDKRLLPDVRYLIDECSQHNA